MSSKRGLTNKFWVELLIQDQFREKVPFFNFDSDGPWLFKLCCEDFWAYITFLEKNYPLFKAEVSKGAKLDPYLEEDTKEVTEMISVFVGLWKKKFCQRVKFVEKLPKNEKFEEMKILARQKVTEKELVGLIAKTKEALIRNGEICGTTILAENLIYKCLGTSQQGTDNKTIRNQLVEEAKQLARLSGNLIFIRLKKG